MTLPLWVRRNYAHPAILVGLTLLMGGLFKLSAFAREAFIAARFGLSAVTDTYFGLQQFPLTLATFMFGAFALAFTPAYADARRRSASVSWLPGLTLYGFLIGSLLTVLMLACAPLLLRLFTHNPTGATWNTLAILSLCYVPIFCVGIWACICNALGSNLKAMSMTGLPYLVMTITLLLLWATHTLNNLGLPISMTAGFALVGLYACVRIVKLTPGMLTWAALVSTWKQTEFRLFLRQLGASSLENMGYAGNQLLILFFLAKAGTGAISANNCSMRIGMLGFSLLAQPLCGLVQAKLCAAETSFHKRALFRRWFGMLASVIVLAALVLYTFRLTIIRVVYMHGKFQNAELDQVAAIIPAWIGYFIVMSLNPLIGTYFFTDGKGATYVRRQLAAYGVGNLLRFAVPASFGAPAIIWCSVIAEGCALLLNIHTSLSVPGSAVPLPALAEVE